MMQQTNELLKIGHMLGKQRLKLLKSRKSSRIQVLTTLLMVEVLKSQVLSSILSWFNKKCAQTLRRRIRATQIHQKPMFKLNREKEFFRQRDKSTKVFSKNMSQRRKLMISSRSNMCHQWILTPRPSQTVL